MSDKPDLGKQTESREAESEINMAAPIEVTGNLLTSSKF